VVHPGKFIPEVGIQRAKSNGSGEKRPGAVSSAINICEMKYTEKEFTIDKAYAGELENKRNVFKEATKTRKSLFLTLVTTFGVQPNDYVTQSVQAGFSGRQL
jgi:hypothetical protein